MLCQRLDKVYIEDYSIEYIVSLPNHVKKKIWELLDTYRDLEKNLKKFKFVDQIENENSFTSSNDSDSMGIGSQKFNR